jgi:transposase
LRSSGETKHAQHADKDRSTTSHLERASCATGFVKARTARANQLRGLLAEYGLVIPVGIRHIPSCVALIIDDEANELPMSFRHLLQTLVAQFKALDEQVGKLELDIKRWHRDCAASTQLATVPGVGPITASALVASIGDTNNFKSGRQMAAWMGLVPQQHSTGHAQWCV